MSQFGNTDNAANSVIWAGSLVNTTANTATRDALFGNTTTSAFITGTKVGQFGVDANEIASARFNGAPRPAHAGWVLRTEGTGGRAGRVTQEVLVAMSSLGGDASDDALLPDTAVRIIIQPANVTTNNSVNAVFSVTGESAPSGTAIAYQWSFANGDIIAAPTVVGNTTTQTLTVNTAVQTANVGYNVTLTAGAVQVTSANATLTRI